MVSNFSAKLKELIVKNVRRKITPDDIKDDSDLINDLKCDSALLIQLVIDIENEFQFEFDDDYLGLDTLEKYSDLRNYVSSRIKD